jgi:hypothetical protein
MSQVFGQGRSLRFSDGVKQVAEIGSLKAIFSRVQPSQCWVIAVGTVEHVGLEKQPILLYVFGNIGHGCIVGRHTLADNLAEHSIPLFIEQGNPNSCIHAAKLRQRRVHVKRNGSIVLNAILKRDLFARFINLLPRT